VPPETTGGIEAGGNGVAESGGLPGVVVPGVVVPGVEVGGPEFGVELGGVVSLTGGTVLPAAPDVSSSSDEPHAASTTTSDRAGRILRMSI
jgi:hypothetical protein